MGVQTFKSLPWAQKANSAPRASHGASAPAAGEGPSIVRGLTAGAAEDSLSHAARLIIRSTLPAGLARDCWPGATCAYTEMPHRRGRTSSEVLQVSPGFLGPLRSPEDPGGNLPSCLTGRGAQPSASTLGPGALPLL